MKKPLLVGYVFKSHFSPLMNISKSFNIYASLEDLKIYLYFNHFGISFYLHQKYHIEWSIYYLFFEQNDICDYSDRCLVSSGLIFMA